MKKYCPHCGFEGTDEEVDEHRSTGIHNDEPQAGSNLSQRPHFDDESVDVTDPKAWGVKPR